MVSREFLKEKEKRPHLPMHMQQGSSGLRAGAAAGGLCRSAWEVGSPGTERQGGWDWDRDRHILTPQESLFHFVAKIQWPTAFVQGISAVEK